MLIFHRYRRVLNIGISLFIITGMFFFFFDPIIVSGSETADPGPLTGKVIGLDAGHGGSYLGAQYPAGSGEGGDVYEKDINIAVVYTLKKILVDAGADVVLSRVCDEEIGGNKDRVDMIKKKCQEKYGQECDILISIHHDGDWDDTVDGVLTIYNNKEDFQLAEPIHASVLAGLFADKKEYDRGFDKGGYGMTVYFTPAVLTEAYYVTNKCEAHLFLGTPLVGDTDCPDSIYPASTAITTFQCVNNDSTHSFDYGTVRVEQEAEAIYQGILTYFGFEEPEPDPDPDPEPGDLSIDKFDLTNTSNPAWARVSVEWIVSGTDLASVKTEMRFEGELIDSKTSSVSGSSASGTHELRNRGAHGKTYDIILTVTDADGNKLTNNQIIYL